MSINNKKIASNEIILTWSNLCRKSNKLNQDKKTVSDVAEKWRSDIQPPLKTGDTIIAAET